MTSLNFYLANFLPPNYQPVIEFCERVLIQSIKSIVDFNSRELHVSAFPNLSYHEYFQTNSICYFVYLIFLCLLFRLLWTFISLKIQKGSFYLWEDSYPTILPCRCREIRFVPYPPLPPPIPPHPPSPKHICTSALLPSKSRTFFYQSHCGVRISTVQAM